jgi:NhaA family Na+:H+ antiporter
LVVINKLGVKRLTPYLVIGLVLWVSVLKSGVHATLAGVILALFIPMQGKNNKPLLSNLEEDLHPMIAFLVLPLFAFANAGIHFEGFTWKNLVHTIPMGIVFGLWLGKPVGVVLFTFITQKVTKAKLLISKLDLLIIGCFAGIGFTMSLFIGSLSFGSNTHLLNLARLGILLGSLLAIITASFFTAFHKRDVNEA